MKNIRETKWKYRYMLEPIRKLYVYPRITILRHAITPTGRMSKYWASICKYDKDIKEMKEQDFLLLAERMQLPKLPKGYTWSEPYVM